MHSSKLFFLASLIFFNTIALSDATEISTELQPTNPVFGEEVRFTVTIKGQLSGGISVQQYPSSPGLRINWNSPSQSQNTSIINGRMSRQYSFSWSGQAIRQGQFTLSPIKMVIGGKPYTGKAINFSVSKQQTSQFYLLKVNAPLKDAYVGQAIPLHIDYCFADQEIRKYERYKGGAYELAGTHYSPLKIPKSLENNFYITAKRARQAQNKDYYGEAIASKMIGAFNYRIHRITLLLEPKKTGTFTIPPIDGVFHRLKAVRGFFGIELKHASPPIASTSQAITIRVIDPPGQNKPESYHGLVCQKLELRLKVLDIQPHQKVQLHSPLSIEIELICDLPATALSLPPWDVQKQLQKDFYISDESMTSENSGGGKRFKEIIIRPQNKDTKAIPPIQISYFDPVQKKYMIAYSKAFPIEVEAVSNEALQQHIPEQALSTPKPIPTPTSVSKIEGLESNLDNLKQSFKSEISWLSYSIIALFPWLLLGLVKLSSSIKKGLQEKSEQGTHGLSDSLRKLTSSQNPSQLLDILNKFICHKWELTDPYQLKLNDQDLLNQTTELLKKLESMSYSSQQAEASSLKDDLKDLLKRLNKGT